MNLVVPRRVKTGQLKPRVRGLFIVCSDRARRAVRALGVGTLAIGGR